MQAAEYAALDGLALAQKLAQGEVTTAQLMECALQLARERGEPLHALVHVRADEARERARNWQARGPFGGIPFLFKDSGLASRQFPSNLGSRLFADTRYDYDATLAERVEAAGLVAFGRSTVSELCMGPSTEAAVNGGVTLNPRDNTRSVGGSSGGAAVAVAAGIVPVAHGSDGGGSIRIPAACCGVFGLKPSRGRVPMGPARGEGWGGMACDGVLTRTVRDTAAAMDVISGFAPGVPYAAPPRQGSFLDAVREQSRPRLRIAVWREAFNGIPVSDACLAALEKLSPTLTQLPAELDYLALNGGFWDFREKVSRYATFLAFVNASGRPAASLPVAATPQGVPLSCQLIGHFGREDVILRLAAEIERVAPRPEHSVTLPNV